MISFSTSLHCIFFTLSLVQYLISIQIYYASASYHPDMSLCNSLAYVHHYRYIVHKSLVECFHNKHEYLFNILYHYFLYGFFFIISFVSGIHLSLFFFFNNPAPPEISPFPLHAALPIYRRGRARGPDAAVARPPGACVRQPPRPVHRRARHAARVAAVARPTPWRRHIRARAAAPGRRDRKSTRLNSSHLVISYAVFCLKK